MRPPLPYDTEYCWVCGKAVRLSKRHPGYLKKHLCYNPDENSLSDLHETWFNNNEHLESLGRNCIGPCAFCIKSWR